MTVENNVPSDNNYGIQNTEPAGRIFKKPGVWMVCLLYSFSVILLLFVASRAQRRNFYTGILITEFVLILLPPLILLFICRLDFKKVLRFNRISPLNIFLIFFIMLFSIPVVNVLNTWYLLLIKFLFGRVVTPVIPEAGDIKGLIVNILVVAGSAGICEEIMFRGVIMRGLERFGAGAAIIVSSILFGIWHSYFPSFLGTFLLGIPIAFIVYRTNSIYGGMFAHFTNNAIAVLAGYLSKGLLGRLGASEGGDANNYLSTFFTMPRIQLIGVIIAWVFIILFCGAILTGLLIAFVRNTSGRVSGVEPAKAGEGLKSLLWLLPGLIFVGFKYYTDGLGLMGARPPYIDAVLRFIGLK